MPHNPNRNKQRNTSPSEALLVTSQQTMAKLQLSNITDLDLLNTSLSNTSTSTPFSSSTSTNSNSTRKVAKRRSTNESKSSSSTNQTHATVSSTACGNRANVNRLCPGWNASSSSSSGSTPPRGQLIFDASFESGNLESVQCINDCEYDLSIRADTLNSRYRVWFYFSVENVRNNQRVVFRVNNYTKLTSLFEKGMAAPVVRSSKQPKWRRVPERQVLFSHDLQRRGTANLTFWYLFDDTKSVFEFALCFPYTYTRLQKHLGNLPASSFYRREQLTLSVQHRLVDLLVIGEDIDLPSTRPIIVITARVHPGETPASIVCQGLIDFLLSDQPEAVELRRMFTFKIVPMLNPDGVCHGNYRCSSQGMDLNRQWTQPSAVLQPSIYATKQMLLDANNNKLQDAPVMIYLDIHGHTQRPGAFIYGNIYERDMMRCHRQFVFPQLLANLASDFDMAGTQLNMDPSKESTSRRVFADVLDADTLCYTLEVSLFCYTQAMSNSQFVHTVPYTEDAYITLGANVGRAMLHFGQVQRGDRICVLQPIKKLRTAANNNNLVFTTKPPPINQNDTGKKSNNRDKSNSKKLRSK